MTDKLLPCSCGATDFFGLDLGPGSHVVVCPSCGDEMRLDVTTLSPKDLRFEDPVTQMVYEACTTDYRDTLTP